jgi:hypothetical protein
MLKLQTLRSRVGEGTASIVVAIAISATGEKADIGIALAVGRQTPQMRPFNCLGLRAKSDHITEVDFWPG